MYRNKVKPIRESNNITNTTTDDITRGKQTPQITNLQHAKNMGNRSKFEELAGERHSRQRKKVLSWYHIRYTLVVGFDSLRHYEISQET